MSECACCGMDYDNGIVIEKDGERYYFDSFECAIHTLAPTCPACGCRVIGHGTDAKGKVYCCSHCAQH